MRPDGGALRKFREDGGMSLETVAELIGLEPHVLSGVEAGWRELTDKQWRRVLRRLAALPQPEQAAPVPGAARPPMPGEEIAKT